jgi:N-acetylmuramoyl-L-alanine amidase
MCYIRTMLSYANQVPSPNFGGLLKNPTLLIIHYTAGRNLASSTRWLCDKKAKASAHIIIGKDGTVNQLVPLNLVAWHAGESEWKGLTHCNSRSIGIELDNNGPLVLNDGKFQSIVTGDTIQSSDVVKLQHKNPDCHFKYWEKYPTPQLTKLYQVVQDIVKAFPSIVEIVGHDDVAPGRKWDPGPDLDLNVLRTTLSSR